MPDRWEQRMYSRDPRVVSGSTGENGSEHLVQEAVEERCEAVEERCE